LELKIKLQAASSKLFINIGILHRDIAGFLLKNMPFDCCCCIFAKLDCRLKAGKSIYLSKNLALRKQLPRHIIIQSSAGKTLVWDEEFCPSFQTSYRKDENKIQT